MKTILFTAIIFMASTSFAENYKLDCQSQVDSFVVEINSDNSYIHFVEKEDFDIAVDDYVYPAEMSKNLATVSAEISTYDYFFGTVSFYMGKGLKNVKTADSITIALDADDGDGFGFDKRPYQCFVQKIK